MRDLSFTFGSGSRETRISFTGSVSDSAATPEMIIVDSAAWKLHREEFPDSGHVLELPGGEGIKTPETLMAIWKKMAEAGLRRDSTVLVAGGGTVCDVGAFAVSTWKRGMELHLVPTTLLCMVDACLGGKTGININNGKNQAGTFYPAAKVLVNVGFLETLSGKDMVNGVAEALKTAVIGNREIASMLKEGDYPGAVRECLAVKGGIVSRDMEEKGERKLLNLGHTIGHCIETITGFRVPHGQAVAMGIPVAARLGGNLEFSEEFTGTAAGLGLETDIPGQVSIEDVLAVLDTDKKTTAKGRTWIVPRSWGHCEQILLEPLDEEELLRRAWRR